MDWPTGIRPRGRGLEVTIWKGKARVYHKILPCDPYSSADLAAAIKHRDNKIARYRSGLPLHKDRGHQHVKVFASAAQSYLNGLDVGMNELKLQRRYLNTYWMPEFGNWLVTDITQAKIKEVLAAMKVKIKTKQNRLRCLRGVLDDAGVQPNPANIKWSRAKKKQEKKKVVRYTIKQRTALIDALDELAIKHAALAKKKPSKENNSDAHWSQQASVYFPLLFAVGCRPDEALGLDWADYDGEFLTIEKQRSDSESKDYTKTGDDRMVYVPQWVRPILDSHSTRFADEAIFVGMKGSALAYTDRLNDMWRRAHKKAHVPYRIPYVCRHTRAAELLSKGVSPAEGASELGHSVPMFLGTYSEFIKEFAEARDYSRLECSGHTKTTQNSEGGF